MKFAFSLFAFALTVTFAQAGGFGGPPPFTNGSPLVSGVDGSYQATARGSNLSGVFRFTYSGGRQTSAPSIDDNGILTDPYNDYIFFVDGLAYRGINQTNVNDGSISGVLDNGAANVPNAVTNTGGATFLGVQTFLAGYYSGKLDNNSAVASFSGNGSVAVSVYTDPSTDANGVVTPGIVSEAFTRAFRFSGVRNSLSTSSGTDSGTSTQ
jgi:hypothetical protein